MGDDNAVRRLVEMVSEFYTEGKDIEEDLTCSLTSEFLRNILDVLFAKQIIAIERWENFFNVAWERMLSCPETYLQYLICACLHDARVFFNIFERFLCTFALVLRISVETRNTTRMNFCKMVPDIFMVFFEKELKKPFERCKGFRRFVQYINNPDYIKSECIVRNISSFYDPNTHDDEFLKDLTQKSAKMISKIDDLPQNINFVKAKLYRDSLSLAKRILEITKTEFIPSANNDMNVRVSKLIQREAQIQKPPSQEIAEKVGDLELISERFPGFHSDSETEDGAPGRTTDNVRYKNIIEAIIKHNHSKSSCHVNSECLIQMEVDGILEQLRKTIKSLIEALDKIDKE